MIILPHLHRDSQVAGILPEMPKPSPFRSKKSQFIKVPSKDITSQADFHLKGLKSKVQKSTNNITEPPKALKEVYLASKAHHNEVWHTESLKAWRNSTPLFCDIAIDSEHRENLEIQGANCIIEFLRRDDG